MSKNKKTPKGSKPKHHIFGNERLNDIFCATPEDSKEFIDMAFSMYQGADARLLPEEAYKVHVVAFVAGVIEASFEMGWCDAMNCCAETSLHACELTADGIHNS